IFVSFKKGIKIAINKTKGIITKERLRIKLKGTLDKKTSPKISKVYKKNERNNTGGVKIIKNIKMKEYTILTEGYN
ncbi:MAG: hypothetical protein DRO14_03400, partial [Thermoprotei archaeon]